MKIRKAVIPAAGFGTRFLPVTKALPKEMLPIIDKPVIQYVMEEAIASGIDDVVVVTGRDKYAIEDYFDRNLELEQMLEKKGEHAKLRLVHDIGDLIDVHYVRQKQSLGMPDAIYTARKHIDGEPFAVLVGDDVLVPKKGQQPAIKQLIETAERRKASCVGACEIPREEVSKFGVFRLKDAGEGEFVVEDVVEKPSAAKAPSSLVSNGRYVFTPEFLDAIESAPVDPRREKNWADAARVLMKTQPIYARKFEGSWHAVGDKLSFVKTTIDFALSREDMRTEVAGYIRRLAPSL